MWDNSQIKNLIVKKPLLRVTVGYNDSFGMSQWCYCNRFTELTIVSILGNFVGDVELI